MGKRERASVSMRDDSQRGEDSRRDGRYVPHRNSNAAAGPPFEAGAPGEFPPKRYGELTEHGTDRR